MDAYNLISFAGYFVLLLLAWLIAGARQAPNWRLLLWGTVLQFALGLVVFVFPFGTQVFWLVNDAALAILNSASAGANFVFGPLAVPPGATGPNGEPSLGFILAFQAFPTIVFFSALMSLLYFFRIMPLLVRAFAYVFTRLMRISGAESLCVATNIFAGVESALTVKPYLDKMTRSELCTILTAGMASVSSNVLALYVFSLQSQLPSIAGHLITASFLSAPAALVTSKLVLPEHEHPETLGLTAQPYYQRDSGFFEAIISGAHAGVKLIVGIVALLLAVLGLVALLDVILGGVGDGINGLLGINVDWTLKGLLGYLFYPVSFVLGIRPDDAYLAAKLIGERAIVTEVVSYQDLNVALAQGLIHDPRSAVIITYALCGFAHLASLAIFVGGTAAIAPSRTRDLARVGLRALLAATIACLLTACVAGTLYTSSSLLLGDHQ